MITSEGDLILSLGFKYSEIVEVIGRLILFPRMSSMGDSTQLVLGLPLISADEMTWLHLA